MEEAVRFYAATPGGADVDTESLPRCEHALELLLTHRGNPSAEVDRVLAGDPQCVFGHCLRAALIVCADATAARSSLVASVDVIEAVCQDIHDPARRHAAAAGAWLQGDPALAAERYGAIVTDCPRDILALVVGHTLDFRLGRRRVMRGSYCSGTARIGDRGARRASLRCTRSPSRRTASIVVPKRSRVARSSSTHDIQALFMRHPWPASCNFMRACDAMLNRATGWQRLT
jgi:hypothetical protein